jgi:CRISPR type III-B/RAMP module-associated protein Cmr3
MSVPYLITFKPYGRFYFGTSQSFGEGFYAMSSMFPTQTTILGAIRATILSQHDLLDHQSRKPLTDKMDEVHKLTGTSKMIDLADTDDNFGKIEKLSPVFLVRQEPGSSCVEDLLFPMPADVIYEYEKYDKDEDGNPKVKQLKLLDFPEKEIIGVKVYSRNEKSGDIFSHDKRIKDYTAEYLGGIEFWDSYSKCKSSKDTLKYHPSYQTKNIFISDSQPGIAREKRSTKDGHYYTKKDFRLAPNFSFGVIVHFSEDNVIKDDDIILGGEKSLFHLISRPVNNKTYIYKDHPVIKRFLDDKVNGDFDGSKEKTFTKNKLVAFSPIISNEAKFEGLKFALINEMYSPRSIGERQKSDSFSAIPYGSVLFADGTLKLKADSLKIPSKIGYNFLLSF